MAVTSRVLARALQEQTKSFHPDVPQKAAERRAVLLRQSGQSLFWLYRAAGEALVFHPDGKGRSDLVARIKIEQWPQFASSP
jgi:lysylphosphatidylglycerol synthetase-like protein (DUF2156 family)